MIDEVLSSLAKAKSFAAFTTMFPSGKPMTNMMWVDADDDHILLNTEVHRRKYRNVAANPFVSVMVFETEDPYRYVEARGRVVGEVRGPEARAHIDALSEKYRGAPYAPEIRSERVILKVKPERLVMH